MKFPAKKMTIALALMGFTYSSNVVYEYQTGQSILRSIASVVEQAEQVSIEVTAENYDAQVENVKKFRDQYFDKKAELLEELKKENLNTSEVRELEISSRKINQLSQDVSMLGNRLVAFGSDSEGTEGFENKFKQEDYDALFANEKYVDISTMLEDAAYTAYQNHVNSQNQKIDSLGDQLCQQNKSINGLVEKIEDLLKDKKEVVDASSDEDKDEDKDEDDSDRTFAIDFSSFMDPSMFFAQMQPANMFSESAGIDPNFLLLSQMIMPGIPGFGGSTNLYYNPTYNQSYSPSIPIMANENANIFGQDLQSQFLRPEYPQYIPQTKRMPGAFDFIQLN
ncbi:MAG: hypothetical protein GY909_03885 [Oligoflexia bacterium]|nr:hypothetical protein [Oligoflexia bacterium]